MKIPRAITKWLEASEKREMHISHKRHRGLWSVLLIDNRPNPPLRRGLTADSLLRVFAGLRRYFEHAESIDEFKQSVDQHRAAGGFEGAVDRAREDEPRPPFVASDRYCDPPCEPDSTGRIDCPRCRESKSE